MPTFHLNRLSSVTLTSLWCKNYRTHCGRNELFPWSKWMQSRCSMLLFLLAVKGYISSAGSLPQKIHRFSPLFCVHLAVKGYNLLFRFLSTKDSQEELWFVPSRQPTNQQYSYTTFQKKVHKVLYRENLWSWTWCTYFMMVGIRTSYVLHGGWNIPTHA